MFKVPWKYSFDSSGFIDAWNRYYPIDLFPTLWEKIATLLQKEIIIASSIVWDEIKQKDDELKKFLEKFKKSFKSPTKREQEIVEKIINNNPEWIKNNKNEADPFVIALAKLKNLKVVTYENPKKTKNHIPAVCRQMKVEYFSFIEFLREENIVF